MLEQRYPTDWTVSDDEVITPYEADRENVCSWPAAVRAGHLPIGSNESGSREEEQAAPEKSEVGYHFNLVTGRKRERTKSMSEAEDSIGTQVTREKLAEVRQPFVEKLEETARIDDPGGQFTNPRVVLAPASIQRIAGHSASATIRRFG